MQYGQRPGELDSRGNWKDDTKTALATHSVMVCFCKGEQRNGIIAEGKEEAKKSFYLFYCEKYSSLFACSGEYPEDREKLMMQEIWGMIAIGDWNPQHTGT